MASGNGNARFGSYVDAMELRQQCGEVPQLSAMASLTEHSQCSSTLCLPAQEEHLWPPLCCYPSSAAEHAGQSKLHSSRETHKEEHNFLSDKLMGPVHTAV